MTSTGELLIKSLVSFLFRVWLAMIFFGVVHSNIVPEIPAFSFGDTAAIAVLVGLLAGNAATD